MPHDTSDLPQLSVKYVVLGILVEHMGMLDEMRRPPRGLEQGWIDFFWPRERAVADMFERCLAQLQQEY